MNNKQKKSLISIIAAIVLVAFLHFIDLGENELLKFICYCVPYLIVGWPVIREAFEGMKNGQLFDENFLMAVATVGAFGLKDYEEACAVMLFYQIGELFQSYAVSKSRRNISDLMDIRPDYANIEKDGVIVQVDPDEVEIGTIITVRPGEKVPIDGTVVEGTSSLNVSALTGESAPVDVTAGDDICSGSINNEGLLKIRTAREFGESTVFQILELVENAAFNKSKSEEFITRFARWYTPTVCIGALLLAVLPPVYNLITGQPALWTQWLYRALSFLVVSCPCALVVSIPLTFFAGLGGASREGILIKGSNYMETLASVKEVVFDKTGTITKGVFEVSAMHDDDEQVISDEQLLEYAAYGEYNSSHPIGKSILAAYGRPIDASRLGRVTELSGRGTVSEVDGHTVLVGNEKLLREMNVGFTHHEHAFTVTHVAVDGRYLGHLLISDIVKPNAEAAIKSLHDNGVSRTVMLTGDNDAVAREIAGSLGIREVHSGLMPQNKVTILEEVLRTAQGKVAFVGDGINDAPVLTRADIGIAMGGMGSDAAIEAADVVLMDDDLLKISKSIKISRKCIRIVNENIWFAIIVKIACLITSALGISTLWLAIFADTGVMVIAVLNSIRALFVKKV